ncbi:RNA-binding protein [Alkalihalobacillus oceani]|uniref:YlmH family RNA-binding protein n=1 Tax=Halalkalibacter oceani TaxID=1653776 RepID=UPI0020408DE9|nr:RNA-binding protein [Halalkalibacter oceani]MCM3759374.1 RNA-binding protein [Halalkalibacter oceani]
MSVYQHFRPEEKPFIDQVLQWQEDVEIRHQIRLTDFLDPRQQKIVESVIGANDDVSLSFSGGHPLAERRRCLLTPPYITPDDDDYQVTLFSIEYPAKFVTLEHRDVLGALMNIGLKREKFGDIYLNDDAVQLLVTSEVANYVQANLATVGKANVKLKEIPVVEHTKPAETWEEATATVSSLRLDVVLAQMYRLSRTKVLPYIEKGLVKVNWKVVDQPSFPVEEGDYISMRSFGRARLKAIEGRTKRDKIRVRYERLQ